MTQTLTSDDVASGEIIEIALVNRGDGVSKLRVVGVTDGGGGGVSSVTGSAPIVITGAAATPNVTITAASDSAAGSLSAADKTKLDGYGAAPSLLIFAPGGVAGGNVFTSFTALKVVADELALNDTPIEIFCVGASVAWPTGAQNFTNPDVIVAGNSVGTTTLTIPVGATISGVSTFSDLTIVSNATAPVISFSDGANHSMFLDDTGLTSPASPFFSVSASGTLLSLNLEAGASVGDGANPIFSIGSGASVHVLMFQASSIDAPIYTGAGTGTTFVFDESVSYGTAPVTLLTAAVSLGYSDGLVSPLLGATNVQAAIDKLKTGFPTTTWTDVGAGASVAVAAQHTAQFFGQDTSASAVASVYTFPAHGTAIDGQEVTITLEGAAVNTPVSLNPGANNVMADPNAAGQYGASGAVLTAGTLGQVIKRKYKDEGSSGKWRPF